MVVLPMSGKLVRDRIPDIIRGTGTDPVVRIADNLEYAVSLFEKLKEETSEYFTAS